MPTITDWIDDKKKSTWVLAALLSACYLGAILFPELRWVAPVAIIGSVVFPFAIFLVWVVDSSFVEKLLSRRWTAILVSGAVIVYGVFANMFSIELLNAHFGIDPAHFPITNIFLTTVYLLVGVFQPFVLFPLWLAVIVLGGIVMVVLLSIDTWKQRVKRGVVFVVAGVLLSASTQSLALLKHHLPRLAEQVALRADFNERHRCNARWSESVDKVIFLPDGTVFAHISGTENYKVLPCMVD